MRLPLGQHTKIGEYVVWITTPVFGVDPSTEEAQNKRHYEVLVYHVPSTGPYAGMWFYVNLNKELLELNLSERNPLHAKVFNSKSLTDIERTFEEVDFRDEFQAYQSRKDMGMPMWRLNRRHVLDLFKKLRANEQASSHSQTVE